MGGAGGREWASLAMLDAIGFAAELGMLWAVRRCGGEGCVLLLAARQGALTYNIAPVSARSI